MVQRGLEAGVTRRTQSVTDLPAGERKEIPQNSFLQFIDEKRGLFAGLSSGVKRLREEEQSWRSSPRLGALLDKIAEIIRVGLSRTSDPKKEQELRRRYTDALFNNTESPLKEDETIQFRRKLLPPYRTQLDEWEERMSQFEIDYQAVRKPIQEATLEIRRVLLAQCAEYLRAEYAHLFDFRDFLADPKYVAKREAVRPFLVSFAERVFKTGDKKGNMLTQLRREWTDGEKENIRDDILRSFLFSPNKGLGPNLYGLLKLAFELFRPGEDVSDEDILDVLKQAGLSKWPEDFRVDYQRCAATTVASVIAGIQKGLEPYRR